MGNVRRRMHNPMRRADGVLVLWSERHAGRTGAKQRWGQPHAQAATRQLTLQHSHECVPRQPDAGLAAAAEQLPPAPPAGFTSASAMVDPSKKRKGGFGAAAQAPEGGGSGGGGQRRRTGNAGGFVPPRSRHDTGAQGGKRGKEGAFPELHCSSLCQVYCGNGQCLNVVHAASSEHRGRPTGLWSPFCPLPARSAASPRCALRARHHSYTEPKHGRAQISQSKCRGGIAVQRAGARPACWT
jgi:hypothetical protein